MTFEDDDMLQVSNSKNSNIIMSPESKEIKSNNRYRQQVSGSFAMPQKNIEDIDEVQSAKLDDALTSGNR